MTPPTAMRDCRYGRMKYLANDIGVGQMLAMYGEYFEGEVALFRKLLRPGDVVISAGGNIGVHLLPIAQIVGPTGRVITFEPQAPVREILLENLEVNGVSVVEVYGTAIGEAAGVASLPAIDYTVPNNFGGMELRAEGPCPVQVVAIDEMRLTRLDMLMLDIEGFELPALRGAAATIAKCRPLLYVEIDRENVREHVLHYIRGLGYELLYHTPSVFNPENHAGNQDNPFGNMCSVMCLGIPQ